MIKAVIFDIDGVLIDSFEANLKFYQDLFVYTGYPPPTRETYKEMFYMTLDKVIREVVGNENEKEVKRIWLIGKNHEVPYPYKLLSSPKGYKSVIKKLNKKYTLAIVTSRVSGAVFKLPQLADLENLFKTAIYYGDTKKHKPEPDPLLLACKRLSVKPEEAVYIGDSKTDVKAAKAAGMKIIVYAKNKLPEADAVTDSFEEIPKLVELINHS